MQMGMIGLGRMGGNMARRLLRAGGEVAGYDQSAEARATRRWRILHPSLPTPAKAAGPRSKRWSKAFPHR